MAFGRAFDFASYDIRYGLTSLEIYLSLIGFVERLVMRVYTFETRTSSFGMPNDSDTVAVIDGGNSL
jgi:hypothetical protein